MKNIVHVSFSLVCISRESIITILLYNSKIMVQKILRQDGVITRNKIKLKERERRVRPIQEAFRGVVARSKTKKLEE